MKVIGKIVTIIWFFALVMMVIGSCVNMDGGTGSAKIKVVTPPSVSISKSIGGISDEEVSDVLKEMDDNVIYEIGVEYEGKRIASYRLKSNDEEVIDVPAGVELSIGVGIYVAANSSTEHELWNSYIVSDVEREIILMPGETRILDFTLDFNKPTRVEAYYKINDISSYQNAPGIAYMTGAVLDASNDPYFTYADIFQSNITPKILEFNNNGFVVQAINSSGSIVPSGIGRIFIVDAPEYNYWFIDENTIYENDGTGYEFNPIYGGLEFEDLTESQIKDKMSKVYDIYSLRFDNKYIYFLNYGTGILATRHTVRDNTPDTWLKIKDLKLDIVNEFFEDTSFLYDVEQDTTPDADGAIFASRLGTFYLNDAILDDFVEGDTSGAIEQFKRVIKITNPYDARKNILITSVEIFEDTIFLGTRRGLYKIEKDGAWEKFIATGTTRVSEYPEDNIERVARLYDEPVVTMQLSGPAGDILVVSTPRRVFFKNLRTGASDIITVWDGIPFVTLADDKDVLPDTIINDFEKHDVSPISFVLWDENNGERFWIGTMHGLAAVYLEDLF